LLSFRGLDQFDDTLDVNGFYTVSVNRNNEGNVRAAENMMTACHAFELKAFVQQ